MDKYEVMMKRREQSDRGWCLFGIVALTILFYLGQQVIVNAAPTVVVVQPCGGMKIC